MELKEADLLVSFLSEQPSYSADFKALVLRIYATNGGDIAKTCATCGISPATLRLWIQAWNEAGGEKKKH